MQKEIQGRSLHRHESTGEDQQKDIEDWPAAAAPEEITRRQGEQTIENVTTSSRHDDKGTKQAHTKKAVRDSVSWKITFFGSENSSRK
jgi:hypothetical protein